MRASSRRSGFSLIELLVVMAILAILTTMLLPAVQKAREAADRAVCMNNMRQMGIALHCYHDSFMSFPSGFTATNYDGGTDAAPGWGWAAYILPYMEENNVANSIDLTSSITDGQNTAAIATFVKSYVCPSDIVPSGAYSPPGQSVMVGPSSYVGICGSTTKTQNTAAQDQAAYTTDGVFYCNSQVSLVQIIDGASNTIMVGERAFSNVTGTWVGAVPGCSASLGAQSPYLLHNPGASAAGTLGSGDLVLCHSNSNNSVYTPNATTGAYGKSQDDCNSRHMVGSNYLFADGSVHFIRTVLSGDTVGQGNLNALGTIAGGDVVDQSFFP